jgi:hypothetical protein
MASQDFFCFPVMVALAFNAAVMPSVAADSRSEIFKAGNISLLEQWHRANSGPTHGIIREFKGLYYIRNQYDADQLIGTRVVGGVVIEVSSVDIRDFEVIYSGNHHETPDILVEIRNGSSNISISDFRVDGGNALLTIGIGGTAYSRNVTLLRGEVKQCGFDGIRAFKDSRYEEMYVHSMRAWDEEEDGHYNGNGPQSLYPHTDAIQVIRSGNAIINSWIENTIAENATSALMVKPDADERISSLVVRGSYLNGGSSVIHIHNKNANKSDPGLNGNPSGLIFEQNLIGRNYKYRVWDNHDVLISGITSAGNIWFDSGLPAPDPMDVRPDY